MDASTSKGTRARAERSGTTSPPLHRGLQELRELERLRRMHARATGTGRRAEDVWELLASVYPADAIASMQALHGRRNGVSAVAAAVDAETFAFPHELLAARSSALLLFASGRMGAADGHWIRDAASTTLRPWTGIPQLSSPSGRLPARMALRPRGRPRLDERDPGRRGISSPPTRPPSLPTASRSSSRATASAPAVRHPRPSRRATAPSRDPGDPGRMDDPVGRGARSVRGPPVLVARARARDHRRIRRRAVRDHRPPPRRARRAGRRAIFYVNGAKIAGREATLRRMIDGGHEIGNHGWIHRALVDDGITLPEVLEEILLDPRRDRGGRPGLVPTKFRTPFVRWSPEVWAIAQALGYHEIAGRGVVRRLPDERRRDRRGRLARPRDALAPRRRRGDRGGSPSDPREPRVIFGLIQAFEEEANIGAAVTSLLEAGCDRRRRCRWRLDEPGRLLLRRPATSTRATRRAAEASRGRRDVDPAARAGLHRRLEAGLGDPELRRRARRPRAPPRRRRAPRGPPRRSAGRARDDHPQERPRERARVPLRRGSTRARAPSVPMLRWFRWSPELRCDRSRPLPRPSADRALPRRAPRRVPPPRPSGPRRARRAPFSRARDPERARLEPRDRRGRRDLALRRAEAERVEAKRATTSTRSTSSRRARLDDRRLDSPVAWSDRAAAACPLEAVGWTDRRAGLRFGPSSGAPPGAGREPPRLRMRNRRALGAPRRAVRLLRRGLGPRDGSPRRKDHPGRTFEQIRRMAVRPCRRDRPVNLPQNWSKTRTWETLRELWAITGRALAVSPLLRRRRSVPPLRARAGDGIRALVLPDLGRPAHRSNDLLMVIHR